MIYGYIRQTENVNLTEQEQLLCDFTDEIYTENPHSKEVFKDLLKTLKKDDTLVVKNLEVLGLTLSQLSNLVKEFKEKNIYLKLIDENIDTLNPYGKFIFELFVKIDQVEKTVKAEKVIEGINKALKEGRKGGRPRLNKQVVEYALQLYEAKTHTVEEIIRITGISKKSLYNYIKKLKEDRGD